jgi:hypothetical protein
MKVISKSSTLLPFGERLERLDNPNQEHPPMLDAESQTVYGTGGGAGVVPLYDESPTPLHRTQGAKTKTSRKSSKPKKRIK